jgi:hypothetical protein
MGVLLVLAAETDCAQAGAALSSKALIEVANRREVAVRSVMLSPKVF